MSPLFLSGFSVCMPHQNGSKEAEGSKPSRELDYDVNGHDQKPQEIIYAYSASTRLIWINEQTALSITFKQPEGCWVVCTSCATLP